MILNFRGTEEIDLNSLEALAIPSEDEINLEELSDDADSIEIDLDDIPEDIISKDVSDSFPEEDEEGYLH